MKFNLKYLYRVVYKDGSVYNQNIEDRSVTEPDKSCFADVKLDQVRYFGLSSGFNSYILDLDDGSFNINGSDKFYLSTEQLTDFKLVHYRQVTLELTTEARLASINFILGYEARNSAGELVEKHIIIK